MTRTIKFTILTVVGVTLGAGVALLLAPSSGEKLQDKIHSSTIEERERISTELSKIGRSSHVVLDKAIELFNILCDQLEEEFCKTSRFI